MWGPRFPEVEVRGVTKEKETLPFVMSQGRRKGTYVAYGEQVGSGLRNYLGQLHGAVLALEESRTIRMNWIK